MVKRIPQAIIIGMLAIATSCMPLEQEGAYNGATYQAYTWVGGDVLALRTAFSYDQECGPRLTERYEVVLIGLDGSESVLFDVSGDVASGRFIDASADGARIVVRDGGYFHVLDSHGHGVRRFDAGRYSAVHLSDDGTRVALVARGDGAGASTLRQATLPDGEPFDVMPSGLYPSFAPDGGRIVFWKDVVGGLYVSDIDGSNEYLITEGGSSGEGYPVGPFVWASNGLTIFYREDGALFQVDAIPQGDSSRVWTFLNEPSRAEVSPDGERVLIDDEFGGFKVLDLQDGTELLRRGDYLCG